MGCSRSEPRPGAPSSAGPLGGEPAAAQFLVGLTGGIGSGKSAVSTLLERRGARVVSADEIAREVVEPGKPAYGEIVAAFGKAVVSPAGHIDRQALAATVFADPALRAQLEAITHPWIRREIRRRAGAPVGEHGGVPGVGARERAREIVVLDIPLLAESRDELGPFDAVVVVDVAEAIAVGRLVTYRGMASGDAWARVHAQASRQDRLAIADFVVDNSGDRGQLHAEVGGLWARLCELEERSRRVP
ncbi:MAG: dephospho-CoA kinase [Acidimicrobiales bacterium]